MYTHCVCVYMYLQAKYMCGKNVCVLACIRIKCSPINLSKSLLYIFPFALLITYQLNTLKSSTNPSLASPSPPLAHGPPWLRASSRDTAPRVTASCSERLMNHGIYDWLRRSLFKGWCWGQAPSNTKQAELMGILWRKRRKELMAGRMERELWVYIGE